MPTRLPGARLKHDAPQSPEARLIGGPIQENKDKVARANPITYISSDDPPFLIVHGDQDALVPHHQSELLFGALQRAGMRVRFHTVEGGGHGAGIGGRDVDEAVNGFFDRHLKGIGGAESELASRTRSKTSAVPMRTSQSSVQAAVTPEPAQPTGLLFFASYPERDNVAATTNPHIIGALHTIYWSNVEPAEGKFDWAEIDQRIGRWTSAGKKVALRIMWSSSGNWPEPAAKKPTPQWVLDKGAVTVHSNSSKTDIPLIWDPDLSPARIAVPQGSGPQVRWRSEHLVHRRDAWRGDQSVSLPPDQRAGAGVQDAIRRGGGQRRPQVLARAVAGNG